MRYLISLTVCRISVLRSFEAFKSLLLPSYFYFLWEVVVLVFVTTSTLESFNRKRSSNMAEVQAPDVNIGPSAAIVGWCEAGVAMLVVGLRAYTQAKIVGRVGLDDYLMILSW